MENYQDIDFKEVGARIRNARRAQRLTQEKAAEHSYITGQFWSRIESGHERASVNTYRRIAAVLGLTLDDIFYDDATNIRLHKAFSKEALMSGCTVTEKAILSETILAMKSILKRNR